MVLLTHGDVKPNPGTKEKLTDFFACCHWNVNSILVHKKLALPTTYNVIHNYDVIFILETYLESTVPDKDLSISEYNLIKADHQNYVKQGWCLSVF